MIKVMIERFIAEDLADHYQQRASSTLQTAMSTPGFISGESLKSVSNPNHRIIFANYRNLQDWENWYHSEARKEIMEQLKPMLLEDEKITIMTHI
ncbi:antibiotic biosynthesis monooxygenase family protein [Motiliproteus sp.]|uniref:antibiotic biosynthesis monooxygenase family protein n=1 Tax=Motiliproteus sp. TaxID=1898955 RepID=UPI003BAC380F